MHPNPAFRPENNDESLAFAREAGFGLLAVANGDGAPMLSHVPFLVTGDGAAAELHLMRSNPIARACTTPLAARIAVQGPHSYVSPDWYGIDEQVPTWNYLAIHLIGRIEPLPDPELPGILDRLSAHFESRLAPKPEWTMDKMSRDAAARMMRQIRPFRFVIERLDSTWKLGQNKPEAARLAAAEMLASHGQGQEVAVLAAMMRRPPV
ncbi:FMN-binding negative transcriptional regulator [Aquicoccus porphyridii]|uniref:FMN-binding negative transcriptional regulator n=1 Tax=Aquicoccus porphyridii TaxID=1852029 RepID=UPI00273F2F12|nr:FMN-binding negative transcriptional regulator [Aquicoccus porphyridii]